MITRPLGARRTPCPQEPPVLAVLEAGSSKFVRCKPSKIIRRLLKKQLGLLYHQTQFLRFDCRRSKSKPHLDGLGQRGCWRTAGRWGTGRRGLCTRDCGLSAYQIYVRLREMKCHE